MFGTTYTGGMSYRSASEKTEGYTVENLRDIGRSASVMNSVAKVLNS